jgi:hypothetical protein
MNGFASVSLCSAMKRSAANAGDGFENGKGPQIGGGELAQHDVSRLQ